MLSLDFIGRRTAALRVSDPDPALDHRHADADLGRRPDRALSRPRADEPGALRGRGDRPRRLRSTEAGLKYFVLGALSSGMLLYGASLVYGFTGTVSFAGIAEAAQAGRPRAHLRPGVPVRRPLLQGLGGAVPHVDARRLRGRADAGHRVLRLRAEGRGDGDVRARRRSRPFPASSPQWQQIIVFVSIASMVLGSFAAIGQRNIKRLMAYSSIGHMGFALVGLAAGTRRGRAGRDRLHGDLCRDDARHLRLHPRDAPRRRRGRGDRRPRPGSPAPIRPWRSSSR